MQVQILKNQRVISDKCIVAKCFYTRLKGWMGRRSLDEGEGMLFPKCNNIHMYFMRIPIDVVFLRSEKRADGTMQARVMSVHSDVQPWRALPLMDMSGTDTLELPAGSVQRHELRPGDELCIV